MKPDVRVELTPDLMDAIIKFINSGVRVERTVTYGDGYTSVSWNFARDDDVDLDAGPRYATLAELKQILN